MVLPKKSNRRKHIAINGNLISDCGIGIDREPERSYIAGGIGVAENVIISPYFPNGMDKFYDIIRDNYVLPKKTRKSTGEIQAYFSVQKDGTLDDFKIENDLGNDTGTELIRVLKTSPKWIPGQENSQKILNKFRLTVFIEKDSLNEKKRKRKFSKITDIKITEM